MTKDLYIVLIYIIFINVVTLIMFYVDKQEHKRRTRYQFAYFSYLCRIGRQYRRDIRYALFPPQAASQGV